MSTSPSPPDLRLARLAWFAADHAKHVRRFDAGLVKLVGDEELMENVRRACADIDVPDNPGDLAIALGSSEKGQCSEHAVAALLAARDLPSSLVAWAIWAARHGESRPWLAEEYRDDAVGMRVGETREPIADESYLVIRAPSSWSQAKIRAALPHLRDESVFPGTSRAQVPRAGRPLGTLRRPHPPIPSPRRTRDPVQPRRPGPVVRSTSVVARPTTREVER